MDERPSEQAMREVAEDEARESGRPWVGPRNVLGRPLRVRHVTPARQIVSEERGA